MEQSLPFVASSVERKRHYYSQRSQLNPKPCISFHNILVLQGMALSACRPLPPPPKENHVSCRISATSYPAYSSTYPQHLEAISSTYITLAPTLNIWRPSPPPTLLILLKHFRHFIFSIICFIS